MSGNAPAERPVSGADRAESLLLDFGGTLDADGIPWAHRLLAAYVGAGGTAPAAAFEAAFVEGHGAFATSPGHEALGFRETLARLAVAIVERLPEPQRVDPEAVTGAFHRDAVAAVERNGPVLERLARRHRLVAVSNFTGNLEPCLEELGILRHFDAVLDSARFGASKPDARIFEAALRAIDAGAERSWMVGDNPGADIEPALRMGLRACWVAPESRRYPLEPAPTARVARFSDLEQVLEVASTV
ncbi:MAG: HAD family hydrolase [Hyphomicrobiales bacterium]